MPGSQDMPDTVRRSPNHAQEIWVEAHDSALEQYGEGERSHRTAFAALKRKYEKVGDHWEAKAQAGPSDEGAEDRGEPTEGGVDANASKEHLYQRAQELEIPGRSEMSKDELIGALEKENARETRQSRD